MRRLTCGNFLDGGMIWLSSSLSIVLDELPTRECWVLSPFELFSLLPLPFSIFLLFSLRFSLRLDGCEGLLSLLSLISLSLLTLSSSSSSIRLFLGLSGRISPFSILQLDPKNQFFQFSKNLQKLKNLNLTVQLGAVYFWNGLLVIFVAF